MTDDFVRELQATWRAQPTPAAAVVARLKRGRWTPHLLLWLELLQGAVGVAFGAAYLWLAADAAVLDGVLKAAFADRDIEGVLVPMRVVFGLAGLVMLITVPPLAWLAVRARRVGLRFEDETPEGVLKAGVRRAHASLRANRIGRWNVYVLIVFVVSLLGLSAFDRVPWLHTLSTAAAFAAAIALAWLWLDLRRERLTRELETCLRLLEEYEGDGVA